MTDIRCAAVVVSNDDDVLAEPHGGGWRWLANPVVLAVRRLDG